MKFEMDDEFINIYYDKIFTVERVINDTKIICKMKNINNVCNFIKMTLTTFYEMFYIGVGVDIFVVENDQSILSVYFPLDEEDEEVVDNNVKKQKYTKFKENILDNVINYLEIFVDIRQQEDEAIKKIQKQFRISRYNPTYKMCRSVEKKIWENCSNI